MTFQLMAFPNFKEKAFTMSYDDGVRQDIRLIEIMQKHGLKGTFNLNSGFLNRGHTIKFEEVEEVYLKTGNEVAAHGVKHLTLAAVSEDRMIDDIINDRKALEGITGQVVKGMAYANGSYDDRVVDILKKCGILYARTTRSTHDFTICDDWLRLPATCHHNDEQLFELADKFLAVNNPRHIWVNHPKLFYLWGHSYEFDNNNNWDRIEKFAEMIGGCDDVWYATNGEIVRYIEAFKALEYSVDGSFVYNPSAVDVYIRTPDNRKVKITAGKTVKL